MDQEKLSLLALHFIPGIGDRLFRQLISYCGSASNIFTISKGKLLKVPGIGPITADVIRKKESFDYAEKELKRAEKAQVEVLSFMDAAFPRRLRDIEDAPPIIYVKGNVNLNNSKMVAIVGTRKATDYGKAFVEKLVSDLIPHSPLVISGLAYGIDIHSHKQALKHQLNTVGVMGSGMDIIYPAAHRDTATRMLSHGGLITEQPFGTKPDAHNFPARNRIIAGLCDALIVVEAAMTGGALITAELANAYNKDVFALPGNHDNEYSQGCNWLIKTNKANLFTSVKDLEYIMNWAVDAKSPAVANEIFDNLNEEEMLIVQALKASSNPVAIDELTLKTLLSPSILANHLLMLELKGLIKALPGKAFKIA